MRREQRRAASIGGCRREGTLVVEVDRDIDGFANEGAVLPLYGQVFVPVGLYRMLTVREFVSLARFQEAATPSFLLVEENSGKEFQVVQSRMKLRA